MNALEIINDLVNERGAVLEIPDTGTGEPEPKVFLVGAFELIPPDAPHAADASLSTRAFWFEAGKTDQSGGHILTFITYKRLHALAVAFYDAKGKFAGYLTQIREAELSDDQEKLFQTGFAGWKKLMADKVTGPKQRLFLAEVKASLLALPAQSAVESDAKAETSEPSQP